MVVIPGYDATAVKAVIVQHVTVMVIVIVRQGVTVKSQRMKAVIVQKRAMIVVVLPMNVIVVHNNSFLMKLRKFLDGVNVQQHHCYCLDFDVADIFLSLWNPASMFHE